MNDLPDEESSPNSVEEEADDREVSAVSLIRAHLKEVKETGRETKRNRQSHGHVIGVFSGVAEEEPHAQGGGLHAVKLLQRHPRTHGQAEQADGHADWDSTPIQVRQDRRRVQEAA